MARTFAALLVDSDLKGLEALVYGFQGADWRITACPGPDTAAFLVKASAADVVVAASREPHDRTLGLVRQLRAQDDTRSLPLLVLGPVSLRASVLESGSVDFLATPVFVRDVISASRIAIAAVRESDSKIEGTLSEINLLSLLRSMSGLGRSGVLQVERGGRRGEILFSEGELTGAQLGALQGSAALHHLLMWEDGKISLGLRAVGRRAPITQHFDRVIDEAERFLRDYSHAISGLGCSSTIFEKNQAKLSGSAQPFPSEVMPIVRLCDGQRTLADLIDQSPFRVFDTIRIVARLIDLGALVRRENASARPLPAQDMQKFWETARIASPGDNLDSSPPVTRGGASETRVGEPNRRRLQRRARAETPVMGTPLAELVDAKPPATQSVAAAPQPSGDANKGKERTSGVLQVPTSERRQPKPDRRERPSVTIDVGLVEAAMQTPPPSAAVQPTRAPTAKPVLTPATGRPVVNSAARQAFTPATGSSVVGSAARPALTPATGRPVVTASPHQGSAASPLAPTPVPAAPVAAASSAPRTGRITGTLLVPSSSSNRKTGPVPIAGASVSIDPALAKPAPSETSAASGAVSPSALSDKEKPSGVAEKAEHASVSPGVAQVEASRGARVTGTLSISPSQRTNLPKASPSKGISVQLDPILVAELDRLEKATAPVGPPASYDAPTAPIKSSVGNRITGTLSVSSSPRSSSKPRTTPGAGISVALDPSLEQEAQKSSKPTPVAGIVSKAPAASEKDGAVKRPSQPMAAESEGSRSGARISGDFSAVESDFFAREADLYKRDGDDNFADLDEPSGRPGGKSTPRRHNRR